MALAASPACRPATASACSPSSRPRPRSTTPARGCATPATRAGTRTRRSRCTASSGRWASRRSKLPWIVLVAGARRRRGRHAASRAGCSTHRLPAGDQRQAVLQLAGLRAGHLRARGARRRARRGLRHVRAQPAADALPPALRLEARSSARATTASSSRSSRWDPKFDRDTTAELLRRLGATARRAGGELRPMSDTRTSTPRRPPAAARVVALAPGRAPVAPLPVIGLALAVVGLGGSLALGLGSARRGPAPALALLAGRRRSSSCRIALGGLFFVLVHHATQAGWSVVVRRVAENAMATLPFLALLFVPLALRAWASSSTGATPTRWRTTTCCAHKQPYLNVPLLPRPRRRSTSRSGRGSRSGSRGRRGGRTRPATRSSPRRLRRGERPGAAARSRSPSPSPPFDWLMSLDPHWYSTIFGVYFFAGSIVALLRASWRSLALALAARRPAAPSVITTEHLHDIGKLLFAFVVFWAYIGFSQFFLIWYGNMPEETVFFAHAPRRLAGGRRASLLAVGHFVRAVLLPAAADGQAQRRGAGRRRRSGCWPCTSSTCTGW